MHKAVNTMTNNCLSCLLSDISELFLTCTAGCAAGEEPSYRERSGQRQQQRGVEDEEKSKCYPFRSSAFV